jgi:hypothetical protein
MDGASEVARLRAENDRLIALLESHGIYWQASQPKNHEVREPEPSRLSTAEKVSLFRRLFRGRTDVYPIRWEAKTSGKSGYSPACANEWRAGVCEKPRIKCGDCGNRVLIPLSDVVIYDHLVGEHTVGVYPLLEDDSCYFLAVDFDEAEWREDARAFMQSCEALGVPAAWGILRRIKPSPCYFPVPVRGGRFRDGCLLDVAFKCRLEVIDFVRLQSHLC